MIHEISRGVRKLIQISTFIKKKHIKLILRLKNKY
jgi:hypothetical protein